MARHTRPPLPLGIVTAALSVGLTTLLLHPLSDVAPAVSLGVLYLLAVLLVSTLWGVGLGLATGIAAGGAFNWFHLPPSGRFAIAEAENWVALLVFLVAALVTSSLAELARTRARDAQARRREADLAAGLARLLLGSPAPRATLPEAAERIADALELESAAIALEAVDGDERRAAVPLRDGDRRLGTLLVPASAATAAGERVAPALEAVLAASEALSSSAVEADERAELADAIANEGRRLSRLVDQLIDLSRLQAGTAEPREDWCSLEEVIRAAVEDSGASPERVRLVIDRDLPLIRADATQLRRALGNLIDNALHYGGGAQVSVRARVSGGRILIRVVDQGPGIPLGEQDRIFTAFYRAPDAVGQGSGLGLAIVRGFVEANGGRVRVESRPGQGSSFVVELPLPVQAPVVGAR